MTEIVPQGDGEGEQPRPSRMLAAIEAVSISPKSAKALAERLRAASEKRHPGDSPQQHQDRVGDQIIRRYAKMSGLAGAVAAVPGAAPGIGTAIAVFGGGAVDLVSTMKLQVDMCRCLAECYGHDLTAEGADHLTMLIAFAASLEELGGGATKLASTAGVYLVREYLKGRALAVMKQMLSRIGVALTQKSLAKAIPFGVGMAVGAGMNYGLTRYVGRQAKEFFQIEHETVEDR